MPLFSKKGRYVLFVHIPKTGGSYIEKAAQANGWRTDLLLNGFRITENSFLQVSPQHFHAGLYEQMFDLCKEIEVFTVVRHPFNRLKSEYYWQRKQERTDVPVDEWVPRVLGECMENPCIHDNHIRPQIDFLPTRAKHRVFKLEEEGISKALAFLGARSEKSMFNRLKPAFRRSKVKASVYEPEIEKAFQVRRQDIETFYANDMHEFGYDRA